MGVWAHPEFDAVGHIEPGTANTPFTKLTTASLVLAAAAGSTASVTSVNATDMGGSAVIASAGTGQAAGVIGTLTFANAWYETPAGLIVGIFNQATPFANQGGSYTALGATTVQFTAGTALVAANSYVITWLVIP